MAEHDDPWITRDVLAGVEVATSSRATPRVERSPRWCARRDPDWALDVSEGRRPQGISSERLEGAAVALELGNSGVENQDRSDW
jgi:hypothetical protein